MGKRLLVTGSAGFIFSHFVDIALAKGYEVYSVDALLEGSNRKNLRNAGDVPFKQIRIENLTKYHLQDWHIQAVINGGAMSNVDSSIKTPRAFESNVTSASNIAWIATQLEIPLVHVSTDEEYGPYSWYNEHTTSKDKFGSYDEKQPLDPTSAYAASKAAGTLVALSYYKTYGSDIRVSRGANTYGTRQVDKLIPTICKKVLANEPIPIFRTPALREWLHVVDHCEALLAILERGMAGEVYNVGSGQQRSPQDIARLIAPDHPIELIEDRKGYDTKYSLNSNKITNELDWEPRFDVDREVTKLLAWYKENQR